MVGFTTNVLGTSLKRGLCATVSDHYADRKGTKEHENNKTGTQP